MPIALGIPEEIGIDCGGECNPNCCTNGYRDAGYLHYESGIDCGYSCPANCLFCIRGDVEPGDNEDAGYLKLDSSMVQETAEDALRAYANYKDIDVSSLNTSDEYVEAIAWFVDMYTTYMSDTLKLDGGPIPGVNVVINAEDMIKESGDRDCGNLFCGDCEDFAILRAALLRALGVSHRCVLIADNHKDWHTFNLVYYKGKYRIMDYGEITRWLDCGDFGDDEDKLHTSVRNIWNDRIGGVFMFVQRGNRRY